ncbi:MULTISPECIES: hypothetical protein [Paenibacillus]|jgi:hypothetical protein|uniref:hypothetical protein n=1 Tax=Paenibacillus TaxID=44249 RepID=UPI00240E12AF|nr:MULTISPECIES: hypothetical protein [Paenibacillus]MCI1777694.1 hypothetical protein [Paenibacillus lautus]WFB57633.1 hypothetical protein P0X86_27305 [Paenibacillus sp. BR1-192]
MIDGKPLMRSMMGERIWRLMSSDPDEFKRETRAYFARGYPGWTVVKVKYPIVYLRDERGRQG